MQCSTNETSLNEFLDVRFKVPTNNGPVNIPINFQSNMTPTSDSLQWKKKVKMVTFKLFLSYFFEKDYKDTQVLIIMLWLHFYFFYNYKVLTGFFCRSLWLEHFSCWLSAPHIAKCHGDREIKDIHWMKEFSINIFVLNNFVCCTFIFFLSFCYGDWDVVLGDSSICNYSRQAVFFTLLLRTLISWVHKTR